VCGSRVFPPSASSLDKNPVNLPATRAALAILALVCKTPLREISEPPVKIPVSYVPKYCGRQSTLNAVAWPLRRLPAPSV
jgi:hypothetical protein